MPDMRAIRLLLFPVLALLASASGWAQTEPEIPRPPEPLKNGWDLAFFTGISYDVMSGEYDGGCPCLFLDQEHSVSAPFGLSVNVPLSSDISLLLRGAWHKTVTKFFVGREDSLVFSPTPAVGEIGDDLTLTYSVVQFDVLLRLIGRQDGERVYFGLGYGRTDRQQVLLTETEYANGTRSLIFDGPLEGRRSDRVSFIIGAEYAWYPLKNLSLIPAFEIDYTVHRISTVQPLRPTFFKLLVSVGYQLW